MGRQQNRLEKVTQEAQKPTLRMRQWSLKRNHCVSQVIEVKRVYSEVYIIIDKEF